MPLGHGAKSPSSAARSYPISYGTSSHPCPPTSFTLSHGASGPHPPTSLSSLTVPPYGSPLRYQFWVCKLNNCITTCYGCRGKFTRAADGSVPVPPLDLILKCNENRQYYDKDGNMQEKGNCNTYYHPNVSCIKKKHPEFKSSDLRLEQGIRESLQSSHFDMLHFIFNVSL